MNLNYLNSRTKFGYTSGSWSLRFQYNRSFEKSNWHFFACVKCEQISWYFFEHRLFADRWEKSTIFLEWNIWEIWKRKDINWLKWEKKTLEQKNAWIFAIDILNSINNKIYISHLCFTCCSVRWEFDPMTSVRIAVHGIFPTHWRFRGESSMIWSKLCRLSSAIWSVNLNYSSTMELSIINIQLLRINNPILRILSPLNIFEAVICWKGQLISVGSTKSESILSLLKSEFLNRRYEFNHLKLNGDYDLKRMFKTFFAPSEQRFECCTVAHWLHVYMNA